MKIEPVVAPGKTRSRLLTLIKMCDSFSWATAWATENDVFDAAVTAHRKMRRLVIGTHRYVTSADCLTTCLPLPQVKVVAPDGPTFHPKVYAFEVNEQIVVYVGSSNLTHAGLASNVECGVFLTGELSHPKLEQLLRFVEAQWSSAEVLDEDFIASYRANKERVKEAQAALKMFTRIPKPRHTDKSANDIEPASMTWRYFVRLVRQDEKHPTADRLAVLARARELFAAGRPFAQLSEIQRKSLAGILKPPRQDGLDWGLFGQMTAFGQYTKILRRHAQRFSDALDHIPLQGAVTRAHFDGYLKAILSVPGASNNWIGMGTRLLTMKRPDRFVCIDKANRVGLCAYFGVAPTTTNLENYWERIIMPMSLMPWWQADMPGDVGEQPIWLGRAALLDAIYYDPE